MADLEQQLLSTNPEILGLERQRKLADLLTGQAFNQPQGQLISGHYVKPSALQQALPMINAAIGGFTNANLDQKQMALAEALRSQGDAAVKDVMQTYQENPQVALQKAMQYQQFPQVKALLPQLSKVALPEATTLEREFAAAKQQGYPGNINDFKLQMNEADKARIKLDERKYNLDAAKFAFEKEQAQGGAKLTESQSNATGFGVRAKESNAILNQLESKGTQHAGVIRQFGTGAVKNVPVIGAGLENAVGSTLNVLPSALGGTSPEQQAFLAAKKNFVTAVLRKESGASISPSEFDAEDKKYFAQVGDSPEVVRQKQHARETAIQALKFQAGPGARFIDEFKPQTDFSQNNGGWRIKQ